MNDFPVDCVIGATKRRVGQATWERTENATREAVSHELFIGTYQATYRAASVMDRSTSGDTLRIAIDEALV